MPSILDWQAWFTKLRAAAQAVFRFLQVMSSGREPSDNNGNVYMTFDLNGGDYAQFIRDFRAVLAEHDSPKKMVAGHPVLNEQPAEAPKRWMHIKLVAGRKETTLAVRDDSVYLAGFQSQNGRWYEFGFEGCDDDCLADHDPCVGRVDFHMGNIAETTLLECDVDYTELLLEVKAGHGTNVQVRQQMLDLGLDKPSAIAAVGILSDYNEAKGVRVDTPTRRALVRLILIFCEATRMIPFFDTVRYNWKGEDRQINMNELVYIWNWGNMSAALAEWRRTNYIGWNSTDTNRLAVLTERFEGVADPAINIRSAGAALDVVQVLLRKRGRKTVAQTPREKKGKSIMTEHTGAGDNDDGNNETGGGNVQLQGSSSGGGAKQESAPAGKQVAMACFGKPLVEVFRVCAAAGVVGTVSVLDGVRRQIIYKHRALIHAPPSQSQGMVDLLLTGPYKAISAGGSFAIQVDGITSIKEASNESRNAQSVMVWDSYSDEVVYDKVANEDVSIGNSGSIAKVTYVVLSDAVEATVQVQLKLKGDNTGATARVHGEISVINQHFDGESVPLFCRKKEKAVQVIPHSNGLDFVPFPLARSLIVAPLDSPLVLMVKLDVECPPNNGNIVSFDDYMVLFLVHQHTGEIERNGVVIQAKVTSSDIYALPQQSDPVTALTSTFQIAGRTSGRRIEARPIPTEQPEDVYVDFDFCHGDYRAFIDNLREKLADHPYKSNVHGRPILAKQEPGMPARWVHIKLVGDNNETTTLAVRDDNVYLIGFQAQNGRWYEFGFIGKHRRMIPGSTFLECDLSYDRDVLQSLQLGRVPAMRAISGLSRYQQQVGQIVDQATKRELARLMVMVCEAARLAPIYNTVKEGWNHETFITQAEVQYIFKWGQMSRVLMDSGAMIDADKAKVVRLVLNPFIAPRKPAREHGRASRGPKAQPTVPVFRGRTMVEVYSVKANYRVKGTISVLDGISGRMITFIYSADQGDIPIRKSEGSHTDPVSVLRGPYEDSSVDGSVVVESSGGDSHTLWDCSTDEGDSTTTTNSTVDSIITTKDGDMEVSYVVLSNALEATVQVQLNPKGITPDATAHIYGEITAHSDHFHGKSLLLFSRTQEEEMKVDLVTTDGMINIPIRLVRAVIAVPLGPPLLLKVKLHAASSSYKNGIFFEEDLVFTLFGQKRHRREIDRTEMKAQVMITVP